MHRPSQNHRTSPPERSDPKEDKSLKLKPEYPLDEPGYYDTAISPSLQALRDECEKTFADIDYTSVEAATQYRTLKKKMAVEYLDMITTAIETFHARTRCTRCKQTPISLQYWEMNHSLPRGAWYHWKDLNTRMMEQRPELLEEADWIEFIGKMRWIEMWYLEGNTASVECGITSWNGTMAPVSLPGPDESADQTAVTVPKFYRPLPYCRIHRPYGKSI
ncbi:uncharacterized protein RSE6_04563 [Rhynchosporium secalis]|uniref:Uncharacterized protein n=1 Tax=Rhynchosporium secalis TaxID=38038 RepID=A0A1E1M5P6_RHYSE|nr:uncharacterized protein RSE6_04563 [Rhynchosporium secalis]